MSRKKTAPSAASVDSIRHTDKRVNIPTEELRRGRQKEIDNSIARRADTETLFDKAYDEAAWQVLYRTESRAFARPESGKIAVKVINHYGDEVMKVYEV